MKFLTLLFLIITIPSLSYAQNGQSKEVITDNCEGNSYRLDAVRGKWRESLLLNERGMIILVARLGRNESDVQLNQRRLYTVSRYLNLPGKIVQTQGEKISERGVIEIYVNGVLTESLGAEKCQDIRVGSCDDDISDRKKYQLPKPKRRIRCR